MEHDKGAGNDQPAQEALQAAAAAADGAQETQPAKQEAVAEIERHGAGAGDLQGDDVQAPGAAPPEECSQALAVAEAAFGGERFEDALQSFRVALGSLRAEPRLPPELLGLSLALSLSRSLARSLALSVSVSVSVSVCLSLALALSLSL